MATNPAAPLDVLLSALPGLPRPVLSRLVDQMIERLDVLDGDTDVEANGDELDGTAGEDDFIDHGSGLMFHTGPGCPIADPDCGVDDTGEGIDEREPDECAFGEITDPDKRRWQRDRIRRMRCYTTRRYGYTEWHLIDGWTVPSKRSFLRRKRGVPRRPRA